MARQRSHIRFYIIAFALLLIGGSAYYFTTRYDALREELETHTITTSSPPGGSYAQALSMLFARAERQSRDLGFVLQRHDVTARGEIHTVQQILSREVDMGLIQGDVVIADVPAPEGVQVPAPQIYSVAKFYDEIFVLFTRHESTNVADFCAAMRTAGTPVRTGSLGPGSQVYIDLRNILTFYHCPFTDESLRTMGYRDAAQALQAGEIDIAFMVAGYLNPDIRALAATEGVHLLELPQSDAFVRNFGGVEGHVIPAGLFGFGAPAAPVHSVSTPATLIISGDVSQEAVFDLSNFIFDHADQLHLSFPQFNIDLPTTQTGAPVHPEARRAHDQRDLNWFERNDAIIKSLLSIFGVLTGIATILFQVVRFVHDAREDEEEDAERDAAKKAA
jgi:TRAP transporter TAXI family solute receptor